MGMALKRRRRAETSPIERANQKSDADFIASYLEPGAPGAAPWTTTWTHPQTGAVYSIQLARSANMAEAALEACFGLIEETSWADYEASAQKWRPADKRREMREPDLRYIVVQKTSTGSETAKMPVDARGPGENAADAAEHVATTTANDNATDAKDAIRGFASLMPTIEESQAVVYCYEIHLKPELQGTGLSGLLLGFLSIVAHNLPPIGKVMLTCFLSNARALRFYHKQGFVTDAISPEARTLRGGRIVLPDYKILSKAVVR